MQTRELKRLLDVLKDTDVSELTLETGEYKLTLTRGFAAPRATFVPVPQAAAPAAASAPGAQAAAPQAPAALAASVRLAEVVSPIVGTFYAPPPPDAPPFVRVGDHVRPGSV